MLPFVFFLKKYINLGFMAITESYIKENLPYSINNQHKNYFVEQTEASAGGALLYINNRLSRKTRIYLQIYPSGRLELESIEVNCPKTSNLIIGCIYQHPTLHIEEFNSIYVFPLLPKPSKEFYLQTFLLNDFNIELLKYESSGLANSFRDTICSNFLSAQIILAAEISSLSISVDKQQQKLFIYNVNHLLAY